MGITSINLPHAEYLRHEDITDELTVAVIKFRGCNPPVLIHKPTNTALKIWAVIEGMEEGCWNAMMAYAQKVSKLDCVHWETTDLDFLFPCENFVSRYMDPVGSGDMTVEEVSAEIMKKRIKDGNFQGA